MSIVGRRRIAAMAAVTMMGIVGPVTNVGASGNVLHAGTADKAHVCTVLGQDNAGNTGVLCVDLDSGSGAYYQGEFEIICETYSGTIVHTVQCADAYVKDMNIADAADGIEGSIGYWECGHYPLHAGCADGRNYQYTDGFGPVSNDCMTNPKDNVWTVVGAAGIELPGSGTWVYLNSANANDGGSESTGHWIVCP